LIANLLTGTLSPVSMLSFTIVSPERRNMSAGKKLDWNSERFMMSPGTRTVESRSTPNNVVIRFVVGFGLVWTYKRYQRKRSLCIRNVTSHAFLQWSTK
jgi:hypothetical protein